MPSSRSERPHAAPPPTERPRGMDTALTAVDRLSDRELQVFLRLPTGDSNREIARSLGITERTVRFHVAAILQKLALRSRVEAAVVAYAHRGMAALPR
ncbi:LuxR C-terminal-related transcriptional regulator [Streptomyces sp. NPDC092296]|uniref:LuxR C-terminal-related transcriptional regulator n=1 Tax=Streptomyces sp. NPDC092296 TaxID=3366012 RepID=UPI00382D491C